MNLALPRVLPRDPATRAATLSVSMNAVLMVMKVTVGIVTGSVAVLSDGIDSGQDLIAAAIVLASVRIGARPADPQHPFGHGRAETIAAAIQSLLIGGAGIFIVLQASLRLINPPEAIGYDVALVAMLIAAGANLALVQYVSRVARATGSPALAAEARHLWTNVVQAAAVITGLALVGITGILTFDALLALALGGYLLWVAGNILWGVVGDVLDASLTEAEIERIEAAIIETGEPVEGFHRLRTRRSGQARHVDFHLLLKATLTLREAHEVADRVEERIKALWPLTVVTIHTEPSDNDEADIPPPGRSGRRPSRRAGL